MKKIESRRVSMVMINNSKLNGWRVRIFLLADIFCSNHMISLCFGSDPNICVCLWGWGVDRAKCGMFNARVVIESAHAQIIFVLSRNPSKKT